MNADAPRFCEECGHQAGRHGVKCSRFMLRDEADVTMVLLAAKDEEKRRYSKQAIEDDMRKEFVRMCPGGTVEFLDDWLFGERVTIRFTSGGKRCDLETTQLTLGTQRDVIIELMTRQAARLFSRYPR